MFLARYQDGRDRFVTSVAHAQLGMTLGIGMPFSKMAEVQPQPYGACAPGSSDDLTDKSHTGV